MAVQTAGGAPFVLLGDQPLASPSGGLGKIAGGYELQHQDTSNGSTGPATCSDMLDRLYRLQADLLRHQRRREEQQPDDEEPADLQEEVRFVLSSMAEYLEDGLLQIIALNLLYKIVLEDGSLVDLLLHLGVMPLLGKLLHAQHSNDLIQDAARRLLSLLADMPEELPCQQRLPHKSSRLGTNDDRPADHRYLPYRVNRMNHEYMRNILCEPQSRSPGRHHERPDTVPPLPSMQHDKPAEPATTAAAPPPAASPLRAQRHKANGSRLEPLGPSSPQRRGGGSRHSGKKRSSTCKPGKRKTRHHHHHHHNQQQQQQQEQQQQYESPAAETAPSYPHSNPLEVSRHPLVNKIFSKRYERRFSPLRDMMQLFQVLDEDNTGLLPALRFEKALGCFGLNVRGKEIRTMLQDFGVRKMDLIDYELFCTSGKIIGVKLINAPAHLPVKPWIRRNKHFEPEKTEPGSTTWSGHQEWFRQRRAKAAVWLMRKGLKALQMIRVKRATYEVLLQYAKKAFAVTYLLSRVRTARKHVEQQAESVKWLRYRTLHALQARSKRGEAYRFLCKRAKHAVAMLPRPQYKVGTVNYQSLYRVRWLHDMAFTYLKAKGVAALVRANRAITHRRQQREEFFELREIGKRALAKEDIRVEQKYKREVNQDYLSEVARKQMDVWERKEQSLRWLLGRASRALEHMADVDGAAIYLQARAEKAIAVWTAREVALTFLLSQRPHAFVIQERKTKAILYCLERAQMTFALLTAKDKACEYLLERVSAARRCREGHRDAHTFLKTKAQACIDREHARISARRFLLKRARFAHEHTKLKTKAIWELKRIVDDVRAELFRATMAAMYKDVIVKVKSDLRTADRERADTTWKTLGPDEVFEAKLREAFRLYDLDSKGAIGRLEFRYLVDNLNLVTKMNKEEFDQFFDMVDKDGSGRIEFEEFAEWMKFEMSRTGSAATNNNKQQLLTKPSLLPLDERALLTTIGMVKRGQVAEREKSGVTPILDASALLSSLSVMKATSANTSSGIDTSNTLQQSKSSKDTTRNPHAGGNKDAADHVPSGAGDLLDHVKRRCCGW